jgi:hypothetical protein
MIENYLVDNKSRKNRSDISWCDYDSMQLIGFNRDRNKENYFFDEKAFKKELEVIQLPKNQNIEIDLDGQAFIMPFALKHIADEIEESKFIKQLDVNWDGENAKKIGLNIWASAVKFLIEYSTYIYKELNIIIEAPEINPCKDDSIDLSWRANKSRLLINIRLTEQKIIAYYYGDNYNNNDPIKGSVSTETISEFLAVWMKSLA